MRYELTGYGKPKIAIWGEHDTYDSATLTINDLKQLQEKIPELTKLIEDNTARCMDCKHYSEGWCSLEKVYKGALDECCEACHRTGDP